MKKLFRFTLLLAVAALVVQPLAATTMLQLDLAQLTDRAGRIFRGTVVGLEPTTVEAGGGELPAVAYTFRVDELLKGEADLVKDDGAMIEVKMLGSIKAAVPVGDNVRLDTFRDVPKLDMGSDYLLFMTPTSEIGLSVSVGLGQGAFRVFSLDKVDYAVNAFDNGGLGLESSGPVAYTELSDAIKALLGQ